MKWLATGLSFSDLSENFHVGDNTIGLFVLDTMHAITDEYSTEAMDTPTTPTE